MYERVSVLFVCLGNICRSPLAEGVFRHLVDEHGMADRFEIDSAGTGDWHAGEPPDERTVRVASEHGILVEGNARQVQAQDLDHFDIVLAMDRDNLRDLERLGADSNPHARIQLLRDFDADAKGRDVPDPYYEGTSGFEEVYHMVRRACEGLLGDLAPASK